MPDTFCSCGTTLVPGARFCHRCGAPQWEQEKIVAPPETDSPPPLAERASPPDLRSLPITFSNPFALRTTILVAALVTLLEGIAPILTLAMPVIGGFAAVLLYRKRTAAPLTLSAGAKLGWMTAVFSIIFFTLTLTVNFALAGSAGMQSFQDQMRKQAESTPSARAALPLISNPYFLAFAVFLSWLVVSGALSVLHIAGAALAARLSRPSRT